MRTHIVSEEEMKAYRDRTFSTAAALRHHVPIGSFYFRGAEIMTQRQADSLNRKVVDWTPEDREEFERFIHSVEEPANIARGTR